MKIAILTFRLKVNYGGILQAYALQTYLENRGHQVKILNKDVAPKITCKLLLKIPRRMFLKLMGRNMNIFYEFKCRKIGKHIRPFIEKYIHSDPRPFSALSETDYDAIIVGSDQVWRPKFWGNLQPEIRDYFLDFTEGWNIIRLAYAASFGTDEWEYSDDQTRLAKELVKQFDAVSVRESSGVELSKKYLGVDAFHLLDPTLLLDKEDYLKLLPHKCKSHDGDILVYLLDKNDKKLEIVEEVKKETSYKSFSVGAKIDDNKAPVKERIQQPIYDWIKGFDDAKLVVTDSFHGCVFSIIFRKPFVVIGNNDRGLARVESLLNQFNLGVEYNISLGDTFVKYCDPSNISQILFDLRENSLAFFSKYLVQKDV